MSQQQVLTLATKKLSTAPNGPKEDAASFLCPRSFDRAAMVARGTISVRLETRETRPGSQPGAGRPTDIRIECSSQADAYLCGLSRGVRGKQLYTDSDLAVR